MSRRRRLGAVPIVFAIALLLIGTIATTLAIPSSAPATPEPPVALPPVTNGIAPPTETPSGRYPAAAESALVTSCVGGIDPNTVPGPIAQAFCVCTVNRYEQLYPSYDDFQRASGSGAITDKVKTDVANQCARQIVGG